MAEAPRHLHPILGELRYDATEEFWLGTIPLFLFASYGKPIAQEFMRLNPAGFRKEQEKFELNLFDVLVYTVEKNTPSAVQNATLSHLLDNEEEVCEAVLRELTVALEAEDLSSLRSQALLRQVEIADEEENGIAYSGFTFSTDALEDAPVCVIYHPDKGLWWSDASFFEALDLGLTGDDGGPGDEKDDDE